MLQRRTYIERTPFVTRTPEPGSHADLVAALDAQVRRIVRTRDRVCVKCGSRSRLEVSHFVARWHLHVRWDLRNVALMCRNCHRAYHAGTSTAYQRFMKKVWGQPVINELRALAQCKVKVRDDQLQDALALYRKM